MFNNFFDIDKSISKNKTFNLSLILDTDQSLIGMINSHYEKGYREPSNGKIFKPGDMK